MLLEEILPKDYPYKIIRSSVSSIENFQCLIRSCINKEKDFKIWMKEFEAMTNTCWIFRTSAAARKCHTVFSRNYMCQRSAFRKRKDDGKNMHCRASLSIRIKRDNKDTRYRDPLLREGFCAIIKINCTHSHEVNAPDGWKWLPRSDETKEMFLNYFNSGMTPAEAKHCHRKMLLAHFPDQLKNSRINPPQQWIYAWHEKWLGSLKYSSEFDLYAYYDCYYDTEVTTVNPTTVVLSTEKDVGHSEEHIESLSISSFNDFLADSDKRKKISIIENYSSAPVSSDRAPSDEVKSPHLETVKVEDLYEDDELHEEICDDLIGSSNCDSISDADCNTSTILSINEGDLDIFKFINSIDDVDIIDFNNLTGKMSSDIDSKGLCYLPQNQESLTMFSHNISNEEILRTNKAILSQNASKDNELLHKGANIIVLRKT